MNVFIRGNLIALFLFGAVLAGGCYHIKGGPAPIPSGGPTGGPTPTPAGTCGPLNTSTTTQVIDVSQGLASINDPTYGPILGYALDPQNGTFPTVSATIALKPSNIVQFANIDAAIPYSAVGFGTTRFPPVPYSFPSGTQNPIGGAMGSNQWSTGRIPPAGGIGTLCYSQQFTLPQGGGGSSIVVFFGDFDHYNSSFGSFRDVIIVSNSAPH